MNKNNKKSWSPIFHLFVWLSIFCSLYYALTSDDLQFWRSDKQRALVFKNIDHCEHLMPRTHQHLCEKFSEQARVLSLTAEWTYRSEKDCLYDFVACHKREIFWHPIHSGFGTVFLGRDLFPFPIYLSHRHETYMLGSGYPLMLGENRILEDNFFSILPYQNAASLNTMICWLQNEIKKCQTRNELLRDRTVQNMKLLHFSMK